MVKILVITFIALYGSTASASSIYKCIKDNKIVFSQESCPEEYRQHEIKYSLGITTETDSDKRKEYQDPLQALLNRSTISQEKLLQLISSEIYRLNQENSYFEILRASEAQKLERKRYWEKLDKEDPGHIAALAEMNSYFDDLIVNNQSSIDILQQHQTRINSAQNDIDNSDSSPH
ncbi:hypothetical protein [Shewanella waksmanii]|uniref:hypothetical protein n=1 Tax=Shewanella waksmanii TaxID=213783 RepID=UPI00048C3ADA|nr:hypothetical protein [Shewanella waksmanii]